MKNWIRTLAIGSVVLLSLCGGQRALAQIPDNSIPSASERSPRNVSLEPGNIAIPGGGGSSSIHRESRVISKGPLAPASEDRDAFQDFLRDRHSGLIRLMPREKYDSETYHVPRIVKMRGGGAYYSFAHLTHAYGYGSDIQLEQNFLSVGFAGADYGVLRNLGDVSIADITLKDPRTSILVNYRVPKTEMQARSAHMQLGQGVVINGELYRSRLPLVVDNTYLLRSIAFRASEVTSDVLVTFRVIRQDPDGSATILWKMLKQN
jgi:hypothetical protein